MIRQVWGHTRCCVCGLEFSYLYNWSRIRVFFLCEFHILKSSTQSILRQDPFKSVELCLFLQSESVIDVYGMLVLEVNFEISPLYFGGEMFFFNIYLKKNYII